jgi:predicted RND superfamily exporter protein
MPNRLHWWAATHARWLLALTAALTLLASAQLVDVRTGTLRLPSLDAVSTQNDAERSYAENVRRRFDSTEAIIVVMQVDDLFTTAALTRLEGLSRKLAALEGVQSVSSLTATAVPYVEDGILRHARVDRAALGDPGLPERLRRAWADNPLVRGQLASADGRAAAILVNPAPRSELDMLRSDLAGRILRAADAERAAGVQIYVTGAPAIRSAISETVTRQLRRVVPAIAIVVTLLLALAFPTVRGVLLPMATIVIALTWTLATLSALGRPLNLITSLVPPLLVTMGLAYCAHVLSEFETLVREHGPPDPVARIAMLLKEVVVPVSVTGLTTIAGLLALLLNEQRSMLEFAWLSALGTSYLVLLTLCFVPAALRYAGPRLDARPLPASRIFEAGSEKLSRFDQQRRPLILAVAGVVFVAALFCAARIEVGDAFVGVFPEDSRVRADYDAVNDAIGGVNPLDIAIDGAADVFTDPSVLQSLAELQAWLHAQPEVGAVSGLVDHVRLLNRMLGGEDAADIPVSRDAIRQMLFVGEGPMLRGVVNSDRSSTLIRLRLTVDDTAPIGTLLDRLQARLDDLPPGLHPRITGSAALMAESVRSATTGQLQSVALALALIYLCLSIQFMSLRIGLLASLPTVLQTTLYFGALGLLGVPLNATTVLVECLVLGLAIDDTIHYLARFNSAAKRSGSEAIAAASALKAVLRPVTLTKAILAIGFLTITTGELRNQALFGWLAALTLSCAWLVDAFVTPAFMSGLRIVTLWDTLRLNLGSNVQKTIPLFAGLTNRQARVFALMANLHTVPAGTRLITEGESPGSIYVVIDGELSVSVGSGDEPVQLARLGRGAVVGEHGYFGQRRNANVDALTEARLLRFDHTDQERICEAYPAIAARVFLSLNRLQAERQAKRPLR